MATTTGAGLVSYRPSTAGIRPPVDPGRTGGNCQFPLAGDLTAGDTTQEFKGIQWWLVVLVVHMRHVGYVRFVGQWTSNGWLSHQANASRVYRNPRSFIGDSLAKTDVAIAGGRACARTWKYTFPFRDPSVLYLMIRGNAACGCPLWSSFTLRIKEMIVKYCGLVEDGGGSSGICGKMETSLSH